MGGSQSSSRRRRQQSPPMYPLPLAPPPPPGYTEVGPCPHFAPYYYHQPHVYQQGYYMPNHHFVPNPAPPLPLPPPPQPYRTAPAAPMSVPEYQQANTVRNDVNLNKGTLRLEKDEAVPGHHVVAFSFDATSAGSISVFFLARETADGSIASLSKLFPQPRRFHFKSGLGQKFKQESGLDFSLIDEQDLSKVSADNTIFPLIIRIETVPKQQQQPLSDEQETPVGGALTKWIHCQQTYAVIEKKDDSDFQVKVVKQIIWVDGIRYELQEIYGIATGELSSSSGSNDSGKECVICMSEPKDTTVLPCRHMCMCSDCANVLRYQTNLCPICRCPVEELLQIKVPAQQIEAA